MVKIVMTLGHLGFAIRRPHVPNLFDIIGDALGAMITSAKEAGHLRGLVSHLVDGASLTCSMLMTLICSLTLILSRLQI
jgi:hypothetical protein